MLKRTVIPLISTAKNDDGSYDTVFFDKNDKKLKYKNNNSDDWQKQLDMTKVGTVMGPGIIGLLGTAFPRSLEGKGIIPLLIFLFLLIGICMNYLSKRDANRLAEDVNIQIVTDPSVYLRSQIIRLLLQILVTIIVLVGSVGGVVLFFLVISTSGISVVNMIFFMLASFLFWLTVTQPIFERLILFLFLMKQK